jgi:hypothetical protein
MCFEVELTTKTAPTVLRKGIGGVVPACTGMIAPTQPSTRSHAIHLGTVRTALFEAILFP